MDGLIFYHHRLAACPAFVPLAVAICQHGQHQLISQFNEFQIDVYVLSDCPDSRLIAIDYDNTITADPLFYQGLVASYRKQGWQPMVCTLRCPSIEHTTEIRAQLQDAQITVYATNGQTKRDYLLAHGIRVGLWLDDMFPAVTTPGTALLRDNGIDY